MANSIENEPGTIPNSLSKELFKSLNYHLFPRSVVGDRINKLLLNFYYLF